MLKTKKKSKRPKFICFICRKNLYSDSIFLTIKKGGKNVIVCNHHPGVLSNN